jgi:pimeloyl-ACP methyl ester carboxylesterase
MSTPPPTWTSETVAIAGAGLHVARAGAGAPVLVLHHDIGTLDRLPFYDALARDFTVLVPSHPGYGASERPAWLRSVRDVAVVYQVLVNPMGIKPEQGEIADQALLSYIDYVRLGFADADAFARVYGDEPPTATLEQWDLNREMTFRIAWKPYMYNPTLPYLLGGVTTPTLVVWGRDDRIVPLECGEHFAKALPHARLEIVERAGHFVDMEQPDELARLVGAFVRAA